MDYLIKDLAEMTGFSPGRIRKWQERFHILNPKCAENGYWYYSNQDLFILKSIKYHLDKGESLINIMKKGRDSLLNNVPTDNAFSTYQNKILLAVSKKNISILEIEMHRKNSEKIENWIKRLSQTLIFVGDAWSKNLLSIADEHFFTHWLQGFFMQYIYKYENAGKITGLVVSFPGDEHITGALLHYGNLIYKKKSVRFCGMLPEEELFRELSSGEYKELFISVTITKNFEEIYRLKSKLNSRFNSLKIFFGGYGIDQLPNNEKLKL